MNPRRLLFVFALASAAASTPQATPASPARTSVTPEQTGSQAARLLASMDWLSGSWSGDLWGGRFHAYYSTPQGGKILSYSRLIKQERQVLHEFEVFEVTEEQLLFRPHPGGTPAEPFTLAKHEPQRVVFENPDKDFPTRVSFQRTAQDTLVITLADPHGSSGKKEIITLQRKP